MSSPVAARCAIPVELAHHASLEWARSSRSEPSRWTDYARLRTLGRGAFGTTHLVRNVVDARLYALKRIRLGRNERFGTDACRRILREVDILSNPSRYENVVRYYGAWVERGDAEQDAEGDGSGSEESRGGFGSETSYVGRTDESRADAAEDGRPTCSLCGAAYTDWEVSFEHWGLINSVLHPLDLCTDCYRKSIPDHVDASAIDIREKRRSSEYLYILMEYAGSILTDVLGEMDDAARWNLFGQCAEGLRSIHDEGIIHRDIKPGNIFVRDGVAKIGDLGLATYARGDAGDGGRGSDVGTRLYAAPEIETGRYDAKADVYSLGIVLVEMFGRFGTGMERVAVLSKIRSGKGISPQWAAGHRDQAELAQKMIHPNPRLRPSCSEVLEYLVEKGLIQSNSKVAVGLVQHLRKQVSRLEKNLQDKEQETKKLRELLVAHGIHVPP